MSLANPPSAGVDIEAIGPHEPEHRQAVFAGKAHSQARRCADGRQDRNASYGCLLHKLEAHATANQQHAFEERRATRQKGSADQLVQCVMPADIFAETEQIALGVEERSSM